MSLPVLIAFALWGFLWFYLGALRGEERAKETIVRILSEARRRSLVREIEGKDR